MCGIAGKAGTAPVAESDILRMCNAIAHRGPDDWGTFVEGGVGLGMRRLSIVDLAGGHQPMSNEDGTVVVVFNGELYNFPSLHDEVVSKGHRFKTRCDTEALVHLYEEYGEGMVARLRGMFAFAIWDRTRRRLLVARDHFGQKPLFYTERGGQLTFASEMKALLADDPSLAELSPFALDQYLTMRFVHPPETFFSRIRALPPAHYMVWENGQSSDRALLEPQLRPQVDLLRGRHAGPDRRAAGRNGQAPSPERRAGGRLPERRARFHPHRLVRCQNPGVGAPHLLHGHSVPRSRTSCRPRRRWPPNTELSTSPKR